MKSWPVVTVLCLAGCSTAPYRVESTRVADLDAHRTSAATVRWTCGPTALAFRDSRISSSAGSLGQREYRFDELPAWVERQLRGALVVDDSSAQRLEVALERAYLETNRSTLSFTLVLSARFGSEPGERSRHYRGMETSIDWTGTPTENAAYIRLATRNALADLVRGENAHCAAGG